MKKSLLVFLILFVPLIRATASEPIRKLARELAKPLRKMKHPRVGLLSFPYHDGKVSSGSSIVSERLTTEMAEIEGVRVVERSLIQKILEEQHLSQTGLLDPNAAQRIGKVLDVDIIVCGTLIDTDGETEVNARSLKADTGEVLAASRVMIKTTWSDRPHPIVSSLPRQNPPDDHAEEDKSQNNEAIEIGYPAGGSGRGGRGRWR